MLPLLLVPVALAFPWYVADPTQVEALQSALDAQWPGHPIEVIAGAPGPLAEGLSYDPTSASLVLVRGSQVASRPCDADLDTQIALARGWLVETPIADSGWVPPPPPPDPLAPAPEPAPVSSAPASPWRVGLGVRNALTEVGLLEGPRLVLSVGGPRWGLSLDGYAALGAWTRVASLETAIQQMIDQAGGSYATTTQHDAWTLGAHGDAAFLASSAGGLRVGPRVAVGLELRRTVTRTLVRGADGVWSTDYATDAGAFGLGPVVEGGLELRPGPLLTLRGGVALRGLVSVSDAGGLMSQLDPTLTADVLFSWGAGGRIPDP